MLVTCLLLSGFGATNATGAAINATAKSFPKSVVRRFI